MQKEQRQPTAVLEDIREGRATDPRRELGNIGGGFNDSQLDVALDKGDSRTVRLLLAGGLKWRVSNAYTAYASGDPKMPLLLLENMQRFELQAGDCERLIEEKYANNFPVYVNSAITPLPIYVADTPIKQLDSLQKRVMEKFCSKPNVKTFLKDKITFVQQVQQKISKSREMCNKSKIAGRPRELESQQLLGKSYCVTSDCSAGLDRLRNSSHDSKEYEKVVKDVCLEEFSYGGDNSAGNARDMSFIYQQILDSLL